MRGKQAKRIRNILKQYHDIPPVQRRELYKLLKKKFCTLNHIHKGVSNNG